MFVDLNQTNYRTCEVVDGLSSEARRVIDFIHAQDSIQVFLWSCVRVTKASSQEDDAGDFGGKAFVSGKMAKPSSEVCAG